MTEVGMSKQGAVTLPRPTEQDMQPSADQVDTEQMTLLSILMLVSCRQELPHCDET